MTSHEEAPTMSLLLRKETPEELALQKAEHKEIIRRAGTHYERNRALIVYCIFLTDITLIKVGEDIDRAWPAYAAAWALWTPIARANYYVKDKAKREREAYTSAEVDFKTCITNLTVAKTAFESSRGLVANKERKKLHYKLYKVWSAHNIAEEDLKYALMHRQSADAKYVALQILKKPFSEARKPLNFLRNKEQRLETIRSALQKKLSEMR